MSVESKIQLSTRECCDGFHVEFDSEQGMKHITIASKSSLSSSKKASVSLPVEKLYEIIMLLKVWFKQVKKWNTEVSSLLIDGNCSSLEKYCEKEQFFTQKIEHPHNDITCRCHRVLDNRHHHPSVFMVLAFIVYNQIKEEHLSEPMMKVSICSHEHRINEVNCEEGLIIKGQTQFNVLLRVLKEYARKELDLCQKQLQQQQQQRKIRQAVYDHDKVETIVWTVNKSVENDNFGGK